MTKHATIRSTRGERYVPNTPATPTPSGRSISVTGDSNESRSRFWCFTTNNYTEAACLQLDRLFSTDDLISYLVYGREIAETGTPHLQGFVVFKTRKVFNVVRDTLPFGTHLGVMKTTVTFASNYCKKEGQYKEFVNLI